MDHDWRLAAACRGADVEAFYSELEDDVQAALRICASCPVREACLDHAMSRGEAFGVWGGVTETARRRVLRRQRRQRTAARRQQAA